MKFTCCFLLILSTLTSLAQNPNVLWQQSLGGSSYDNCLNIIETMDGGLMAVGVTKSNDGDVGASHPYDDAWFIKLDVNGQIEWDSLYPGVVDEIVEDVVQMPDSSYYFTGTYKIDTFSSGNYWDNQIWVGRMASNGSFDWTIDLGGPNNDAGHAICWDGGTGVVVAGHMGTSGWDELDKLRVVHVDSAGNVLWTYDYGGSGEELAYDVIRTQDGGYAAVGKTSSQDGDVSNPHGSNDLWLIKLDNAGLLEWELSLGGQSVDDGRGLTELPNGDIVVIGSSNSTDSLFSSNHGGYDLFAARIDTAGSIVWQKLYGGSDLDRGFDVDVDSDGNVLLVGYTRSNDGDVATNAGADDFWMIKVDPTHGTLLWEETTGGTSGEGVYAGLQTSDGGYVMAGGTLSNDVDVNGHNGNFDYWIVKLMTGTHVPPIATSSFQLYPNPSTGDFVIASGKPIDQLEIIGLDGTLVHQASSISCPAVLSFPEVSAGIYLVRVMQEGRISSQKLILE